MLKARRDRWRRHQLERRLSGDRRAGAWADSRAIRMRHDFLRRGWFLVALWPAIAAAVSPAALLVPKSARGFYLGAVAATGLWGAIYMVGTMSGASPAAIGALAEQWTARELRRLRKRGWKLINSVHYRSWDIDHVMIGPGGALVVETKFTAEGWTPSRYTNRLIEDAVARAKRNASDIRMALGWSALTEELVHSLVVLWGRGDLHDVDEQRDGVRLISGHLLRARLAEVVDAGLNGDDIERLYEKLTAQVQKRDRHDLAKEGPAPRPISTSVILLGAGAVLGMVGFVTEVEVLHLVGWGWGWVLLVGASLFVAQIPLRQIRGTRPWRIAWITGTQFVTAATTLAYIGQAVSRIW